MSRFTIVCAALCLLGASVKAQINVPAPGSAEVYTDLSLLKYINAPILAEDSRIGVGYSVLTPEMQNRLLTLNHSLGRCAGFEALAPAPVGFRKQELQNLTNHVSSDIQWSMFTARHMALPSRPEIVSALGEIRIESLKEFVAWASSFPNRYNRAKDPNVAVRALVQRLQATLSQFTRRGTNVQLDLIKHHSTDQQTVRVRILGATRPQEVVVLGAHFDSINVSGDPRAPGADDNASGSADLVEVLRILAGKPAPARTLEFYWYAGEESGLLGSAEIAKDAKAQHKQVVGVLQLDMTLHPGAGDLVVGSMTDYTSTWLRDFLVAMNETYLKIKIVEDRCGYGCSDHASWYRQGYPTLMPFEATMSTMNQRLHTANDVVNPQSSFDHAMIYARIAMIFAMELANSDAHQPYTTL